MSNQNIKTQTIGGQNIITVIKKVKELEKILPQLESMSKSNSYESKAPVSRKQLNKQKSELRKVNTRRNTTMNNTPSSVSDQFANIASKGYGKALLMEPHVKDFAKVYGDPFNKVGARLPVFPVIATELVYNTARGTGKTNALGIGYVVVNPMDMFLSDTGSVAYSNGAAAPNSIQISGADLGTAPTNSEYIGEDFWTINQQTKQARIVACGIGVSYTGTVLNQSGKIYSAQMAPRFQSLEGFTDTKIAELPVYKEYEFSNSNWHYVTRHIVDNADFSFQALDKETGKWKYVDAVDTNTQSLDNGPRLAMYFIGTPNSSYDWKIALHGEVYGSKIHRTAIVKPNNHQTALVTHALAEVRSQDTTTPDHAVEKPPTFWNKILNGALKVLPTIGEVVASLL